jgi:hypothetical protein
MFNSKKAQISDTMSWIVATIIIVLILSIPILLINFGSLKGKSFCFLRLQDLIATKSMSGYLYQNYNSLVQMVKDEDNKGVQETKDSLDSFIASLSRGEREKWFSDINGGGENFPKEKILNDKFDTSFYLDKNNEKILATFYAKEKSMLVKSYEGVGYNFECS